MIIAESEEARNAVHELIDLTPDPNPELPTNQTTQETREDRKNQLRKEADSLLKSSTPATRNDPIPRKLAGLRKRNCSRGKRKRNQNKQNRSLSSNIPENQLSEHGRIPTVTVVLIEWEKKEQNLLESCLLRGITKGIFRSFDSHTCGPSAACLREDNYIKHFLSKAQVRRLFHLAPWVCRLFPGFRTPLVNF